MATTRSDSKAGLERALEGYRRELTGYCYRMLGSGFEAEDAVQETMVRAWRGIDRLDAPAAMRSWLYRIATNVCLDMLKGTQRRARPMDLGPSSTADSPLDGGLPEHMWVQPWPDDRLLPDDADPAELTALRETIRLAFVAALQHLPPRQRAVLVLREVLRWKANEVAALLDTSIASVNSALQRARATIDALDLDAAALHAEPGEREVVDRYVDAFQRYDVDAIVGMLREDVAFSMPPHRLWLTGPEHVRAWLLGPGAACAGSRVIELEACGGPAYAHYKPAADGVYEPFAITLVEVRDGRIAALHNFLEPELFPGFGLPPRLTG
ncbi:MAG TPA: sigma-70 family RNA polymerase sigma factor [Capillimicrobium sp.]|nr:sigma-70 family RNA polymerase sigma factor [Capillimicrobium sp.]